MGGMGGAADERLVESGASRDRCAEGTSAEPANESTRSLRSQMIPTQPVTTPYARQCKHAATVRAGGEGDDVGRWRLGLVLGRPHDAGVLGRSHRPDRVPRARLGALVGRGRQPTVTRRSRHPRRALRSRRDLQGGVRGAEASSRAPSVLARGTARPARNEASTRPRITPAGEPGGREGPWNSMSG